MKAFFDMMHEGPHKVMLFGAACTQVTDPIAKASKHWRITQVNNTVDLTRLTIIHLGSITILFYFSNFSFEKKILLYKYMNLCHLYFI